MTGNSSKIILDLCGGTGAWSRPYKEAGYDVRLVTLPEHDVRTYVPPENVHGILAAPPCDDFAVSGARWFKAKDSDGRTMKSMGVVISCLRIISLCPEAGFWVMENPVSRLSRWMGKPAMIFNPCDYGDPYTKKTCLWGRFWHPKKNPVKPVPMSQNPIWRMAPGPDRKTLRSITPPGFAKAFFEANP